MIGSSTAPAWNKMLPFSQHIPIKWLSIVYWDWEDYKTVGGFISRERKNTPTQKKKIILND